MPKLSFGGPGCLGEYIGYSPLFQGVWGEYDHLSSPAIPQLLS